MVVRRWRREHAEALEREVDRLRREYVNVAEAGVKCEAEVESLRQQLEGAVERAALAELRLAKFIEHASPDLTALVERETAVALETLRER